MVICPGEQEFEIESLSELSLGQLFAGLSPVEKLVWALALVVSLGGSLAFLVFGSML